jgi:hypothetical protein
VTERYECIRSARRRRTFLIHYEGEDGFYAAPEHARRRGIWTDRRTDDVTMLKPEYRLALARDGYVLIRNAPLGWKETM